MMLNRLRTIDQRLLAALVATVQGLQRLAVSTPLIQIPHAFVWVLMLGPALDAAMAMVWEIERVHAHECGAQCAVVEVSDIATFFECPATFEHSQY